eukprot:3933025-Rhodomonas_salina.2
MQVTQRCESLKEVVARQQRRCKGIDRSSQTCRNRGSDETLLLKFAVEPPVEGTFQLLSCKSHAGQILLSSVCSESAMVGSSTTEAVDSAVAIVDSCCCFRVLSSFNFCFLVFQYSRVPLHRSHAGHLYSRISFRMDWSRGKRAG